jgi:hypothetical protein
VWTIDFKGWWYTRNRQRFEPLTIRDDYSRYLLCARAMGSSRSEAVREQMSQVFERYGLPEVIRSDNGPPFAAAKSPLGLSRLSSWWLTMGINLDRIAPGHPEQNGGHERMHRDVANEVQSHCDDNLEDQQARLDVWRQTFNDERPHEALGMRVPSEVYTRSSRAYDSAPVELVYPPTYWVRKISPQGSLKLKNVPIGISEALQGYQVGLEPMDSQHWGVWFCQLRLGELDLETQKFQPTTGNE